MRDHHLTSLRNGVLAALGLLQACAGRADELGAPDVAADALTPGGGENEVLHGDCAAMLAGESQDGACLEGPRYAWDGARCVALRCGCTGTECDVTFSSVMSCYDERGACDPLAAERAACIDRYPSQGEAAGEPIVNECLMTAGTGCESASLISEAAAVCIAEAEGMAECLEPWTVGLFYNSQLGRIVRGVTCTTQRDADGSASGWSLSLDAITGLVLESSGWIAVPGRPFLVERAPRTAEAVRRSDYAASAGARLEGIPAEVRAALAAEWTGTGLMEHASVAAFARFALQLLGLGAPPELVEACQQAMQDELRHTRMAFGLASAYAEAPIGPGRLKLDGALDSPSDDLLEHVVMTTFVEGCIGETIAALDAREGASTATDPHVRQILSEIAADEERHAELAWRFLDWALAQRPGLATPLLARARAQLAGKSSRLTPGGSPATSGQRETSEALLEHGILPLSRKRGLEAQALDQVIVPCLVALAGKHSAALLAAALPSEMEPRTPREVGPT